MFEQLFTYRGVLSRHREAPLVQERERYLAARAAVGLAPDTLRNMAQELRIIAQTLALSADGSIDTATINVAAEQWAQSQPHRQNSQDRQGARLRFVRVATEWFRFLGDLDEPKGEAAPFTGLLEAFATCMHREQGLSPKTLSKYTWFTRQFCQWFSTQDRLFSDVTVGDVDAFLTCCGQRWCRVSVATAAKALRAFFRYAEHRQWCAAGIAAAIESPRLFQQETLPTGPTWPEVQQLLAQTLTDRPRDIRDHAILMLFAIYGLRSGEVSALRFDQLDWTHEQITIVRPKQHYSQVYPLTQNMGTALIRYLREVRPRCKRREVFLTLRAPWRPLSTGALHHLTRTRLAQVGYEGQHGGPHTLRHACAAHLVAGNLSLKEIGDHLGHRSPYATRTYAKVDVQRLREVARFDVGELL
jgi:site-specific recombinase XerD